MSEGKFIVLEGPDGSGKSTQARLLVDALRGSGLPGLTGGIGVPIEHLRDPGSTATGEKIREILLGDQALRHEAELFLFLASRAQLVSERILPALHAGSIVVCERFVASTFCYQVFPHGHASDPNYLRTMFTIVQKSALDLVPTLTILLDVVPSIGLSRKVSGGPRLKLDRIESRGEPFQESVRAGYSWLRNENLIPNLASIPPGTVEETHLRILSRVREAVLAR